jgi:L-histidine Nalpha-methyltransferase
MVTTDAAPVRVDVHVTPATLAEALAADVRAGLSAAPKELPPKWFYDDRGSELFDAITRLPEYYPTRAERAVLAARAADVARETGADTLVELGSGTSDKTRLLLDALAEAGTLRRFAPFDVSEATLRGAATAISREYGIPVHAVVGDFEHHLGRLPGGGRRLVAFLGGTIGNLAPAPRAAFNRNVLRVVNRALDADFVPERFEHVAVWEPEPAWIEMRLRAREAHAVRVAGIGLAVDFEAGEELRTEISAKFTRPGVEEELDAAGLTLRRWWTDPAGDFGVSLATPS